MLTAMVIILGGRFFQKTAHGFGLLDCVPGADVAAGVPLAAHK